MKNFIKNIILLTLLPFSIAFGMEPVPEKGSFEEFEDIKHAIEGAGEESYMRHLPIEMWHEALRYLGPSIKLEVVEQLYRDAIIKAQEDKDFSDLEKLTYFKLKPIADAWLNAIYSPNGIVEAETIKKIWTFLLKAGANINEIVKNESPMFNNATMLSNLFKGPYKYFVAHNLYNEFIDLLTFLLKHGANPNIMTWRQSTLDRFILSKIHRPHYVDDREAYEKFINSVENLLKKYGAKTREELLQEIQPYGYFQTLPLSVNEELYYYLQQGS